MVNFTSFRGTITMIEDFMIGSQGQGLGCFKLISVENPKKDLVNFVVSPSTYFLDQDVVFVGDRVIGYYDANAPVPLIFPPQFRALVMVKDSPYRNVKVDYFDRRLVSKDGSLRLNLSRHTIIELTNGQPFTRNIGDRNLIAIYGPTTKSIPAQTTPFKIVVWCDES